MMNIACINSQIIYKANTQHLMLRRKYLKDVAMVFVKQYMSTMSSIETLNIPLRNQTARFVPAEQASTSKEGNSSICPSKKIREKRVFQMAKLLCNEHCTNLCQDCFDKAYSVDVENI